MKAFNQIMSKENKLDKKLFKIFHSDKFTLVLLDLLLYDRPSLVKIAFEVLIRNY